MPGIQRGEEEEHRAPKEGGQVAGPPLPFSRLREQTSFLASGSSGQNEKHREQALIPTDWEGWKERRRPGGVRLEDGFRGR